MFDVAMPFLYYSGNTLNHEFGSAFHWHCPQIDCPWNEGYYYRSLRGWLWVSSHSMEGPDIPCRLLTYTYRLVDVVREYSHLIVVGPTALMDTIASDPAGRDMFEYWHYEDLGSDCPATVEDLFDAAWQAGPLFYDLQESEALHVAEGHISGSMAREYVQLSTFVASEDYYHGPRALLRNRD